MVIRKSVGGGNNVGGIGNEKKNGWVFVEIVGWEYWDRLGYKEVIEISEVHVGEEVISFSGERMGGIILLRDGRVDG